MGSVTRVKSVRYLGWIVQLLCASVETNQLQTAVGNSKVREGKLTFHPVAGHTGPEGE